MTAGTTAVVIDFREFDAARPMPQTCGDTPYHGELT